MHVQHLTIVVIVVRQFKFILEAHLLFSNVEPSMQIANPFAVCYFVFTAWHYASTVYAIGVCVCVSVCLSVTLQYCIKTAKHRIVQIIQHDSIIVWCQRSRQNWNGITPYGGAKCKWGRFKSV